MRPDLLVYDRAHEKQHVWSTDMQVVSGSLTFSDQTWYHRRGRISMQSPEPDGRRAAAATFEVHSFATASLVANFQDLMLGSSPRLVTAEFPWLKLKTTTV